MMVVLKVDMVGSITTAPTQSLSPPPISLFSLSDAAVVLTTASPTNMQPLVEPQLLPPPLLPAPPPLTSLSLPLVISCCCHYCCCLRCCGHRCQHYHHHTADTSTFTATGAYFASIENRLSTLGSMLWFFAPFRFSVSPSPLTFQKARGDDVRMVRIVCMWSRYW